jgi:hypothetical protein
MKDRKEESKLYRWKDRKEESKLHRWKETIIP